MDRGVGLVLLGDVVAARRDPLGAAAWLRDLVGGLDELYGAECLAPFAFTQGDELQGLLVPTADPFRAILHATLEPHPRRMRWVAVRGPVDPGEGPATQRTGEAFLIARDRMEQARREREAFGVVVGAPEPDLLLADLAPVLADLLERLTERQRLVARLALVEELRQAEVAERLGVRRATISISFSRAAVGSLRRLLSASRHVYETAAVAGGRDCRE